MVAILAQRTTDGAGKPAPRRSVIGTSLGQGGLAALVIIKIQSSSCAVSSRPAAITSAGRCSSAGPSPSGKGTLTTSQVSKLGIGAAIVLRIPLFVTRCGALVARRDGFRHHHAIVFERVEDGVADTELQRGANGARYRGLRFARQLARNHRGVPSRCVTECREFR